MSDNPMREVIARGLARKRVLDNTRPGIGGGTVSESFIQRAADHAWRDFVPDADAAIAAIEASGNCIVPLEPTHAMSIKGDDEMCDTIVNAADVYRAMLSVRPRDAASTNKEE